MSTGGISTLLSQQPHRFDGLVTIGKIVFVFFLILLLFNIAMITLRFILIPRALKASLVHPTESLFFPCAWLSFAVLLLNMEAYGIPHSGKWLIDTLRVMFWVYAGSTFVLAVTQYSILVSAGRHMTIHSMTPAWILPVFPAMLTGTLASSISATQPVDRRIAIIVAGVSFQGLGFLISLMMMALFMYRLMVEGLPDVNLRPGMFMAVGPPSFTSLALIGMARNLPDGYDYFARHPSAADVLQTMALFISIFLWLFSFFFFCIATVACVKGANELHFGLICWAFVFPNIGWTVRILHYKVPEAYFS
jgi:C4-dicarboxylate transporter/malic acid transport protein